MASRPRSAIKRDGNPGCAPRARRPYASVMERLWRMKMDELTEGEFEFSTGERAACGQPFRPFLYLRCCLLRRPGVVWQTTHAEASRDARVDLVLQQRTAMGTKQ